MKWFEVFKSVSEQFMNNDVEYVFVKLLLHPFEPTDLDIMIPDPQEEAKALDLLVDKFRFQRGAILEGPRRVVCKLNGMMDLDIYPNACWGGLRVADGKEIVSRRISVKEMGIRVYLPSPDDAFYLIATHAYSHLRITEREIQNSRKLLEDTSFEWERVYKLATQFGMEGPVNMFIDALNNAKSFPIEIPKFSVVRHFHSQKLFGKVPFDSLVSDALWHIVRPLTKWVGVR